MIIEETTMKMRTFLKCFSVVFLFLKTFENMYFVRTFSISWYLPLKD